MALTKLFCRLLMQCRVHDSRLRSVKHCHIFIIFIILLQWLQFQLVIRHRYQPILAAFALLPVKAAHNRQLVSIQCNTHTLPVVLFNLTAFLYFLWLGQFPKQKILQITGGFHVEVIPVASCKCFHHHLVPTSLLHYHSKIRGGSRNRDWGCI